MSVRCYFQFNEPRANSNTEENEMEPKNVSRTDKSDVVKPSANFLIVGEKTINCVQVNNVIEKPKMKNTQAGKNLKKTNFNFKVSLQTLLHKTSVDARLLQLKICARNQQKKKNPKNSLQFSAKLQNDSFF